MEIMMTIVGWAMFAGITLGAIGGWLVFAIAWLIHLHTNGRFEVLTRLRIPRLSLLSRRKQVPET